MKPIKVLSWQSLALMTFTCPVGHWFHSPSSGKKKNRQNLIDKKIKSAISKKKLRSYFFRIPIVNQSVLFLD